MSSLPESDDALFIRSLLAESGVEETPQLMETLLELRAARPPLAPLPSGDLAALLSATVIPITRRLPRRGIILGAALVGAMAAGTTGVAASSSPRLSSESFFGDAALHEAVPPVPVAVPAAPPTLRAAPPPPVNAARIPAPPAAVRQATVSSAPAAIPEPAPATPDPSGPAPARPVTTTELPASGVPVPAVQAPSGPVPSGPVPSGPRAEVPATASPSATAPAPVGYRGRGGEDRDPGNGWSSQQQPRTSP